MKLKEIIDSLPEKYDATAEQAIVKKVNEIDVPGFTKDLADLLAFAISDHYNALARVILEKNYQGKKIDLQNINQAIINQSEEKYSLLHFTTQFGNKEMIIYFLRHQVEITTDKDQLTPLHTLTFARNLTKKDVAEIIHEFERVLPNIINQRDIFHLTPLHYAAYNDNMPALEALVESGAKR